MVNKPKRNGTFAETAVASFLVTQGWPYAERRSLQGALDKGDITGTPGICWEVKSTTSAHHKIDYSGFLRECETERRNAKAEFGVVVVKPKGRGALSVDRWVTAMYLRDVVRFQVPLPAFSVALTKGGILPMLDGRHGHDIKRVVFCPPGKKEDTGAWHCFMLLKTMVELLQLEGFGDHIPSTRPPASGLSIVEGAEAISMRQPGASP